LFAAILVRGLVNIEWKLFDRDGSLIQEVNCQYDSLDLAVMLRNAKKVEVDFEKKEARIIE
jgi:hypothetical protein